MNTGDKITDQGSKAIEVSGLTKVYAGGVLALDRLTLSIEKGTTYALLGPNGAGKTTTLSILTTLMKPTTGTARICGFYVLQDEKKVRRSIGVTFQEMILDDSLTGRQVLTYHGQLYRMSRSECSLQAKRLLKLVELDGVADRRCKTYSGGMKRRLELARALMTVPKILFLDEPTLGLDPTGRAQIWEYIRGLVKDTGLTVLLTTHYLDEAYQLADTVGILDHGRLAIEGPPDRLIEGLGSDTIVLRGRGPTDDLVRELTARRFVETISVVENGLLIGVSSASRNLAEIVSEAGRAGFTIEDISVSKPDLGAVFAKYTGHTLPKGEVS